MWKLNTTFLNNHWAKEEIKKVKNDHQMKMEMHILNPRGCCEISFERKV